MATIAFVIFLVTSISQSATPERMDSGWMYAGGPLRWVRFVTETSDASSSGGVWIAPQHSGYIAMEPDSFTVSISGPWSVSEIEYSNGILSERHLSSSRLDLGEDLNLTRKGQMTYVEAFSIAMSEIACPDLGQACKEFLTHPVSATTGHRIHKDFGQRTEVNIVFGQGRGALLSYVETTPIHGNPSFLRRITCTFSRIFVR